MTTGVVRLRFVCFVLRMVSSPRRGSEMKKALSGGQEPTTPVFRCQPPLCVQPHSRSEFLRTSGTFALRLRHAPPEGHMRAFAAKAPGPTCSPPPEAHYGKRLPGGRRAPPGGPRRSHRVRQTVRPAAATD